MVIHFRSEYKVKVIDEGHAYFERRSRVDEVTAQYTNMDASMQLVAKFCSEQLGKYMSCVNENPHSWDKDCEELKVQLASCAQKNPTIKNIRENCVVPFTSYEKCIRQNVQQVWTCNTQLSDFIQCAEKHAGGTLTE